MNNPIFKLQLVKNPEKNSIDVRWLEDCAKVYFVIYRITYSSSSEVSEEEMYISAKSYFNIVTNRLTSTYWKVSRENHAGIAVERELERDTTKGAIYEYRE